MWHQSARFEKSWPPFHQIWIIFTHLKLWIVDASAMNSNTKNHTQYQSEFCIMYDKILYYKGPITHKARNEKSREKTNRSQYITHC